MDYYYYISTTINLSSEEMLLCCRAIVIIMRRVITKWNLDIILVQQLILDNNSSLNENEFLSIFYIIHDWKTKQIILHVIINESYNCTYFFFFLNLNFDISLSFTCWFCILWIIITSKKSLILKEQIENES